MSRTLCWPTRGSATQPYGHPTVVSIARARAACRTCSEIGTESRECRERCSQPCEHRAERASGTTAQDILRVTERHEDRSYIQPPAMQLYNPSSKPTHGIVRRRSLPG